MTDLGSNPQNPGLGDDEIAKGLLRPTEDDL